MKLSDEAIAEFRALYRKHYGDDLTDEVAEQEALALIRLVAITQPIDHSIHEAITAADTDAIDVEKPAL
jgi:hypothetical protein